jgi:hypothetical protein
MLENYQFNKLLKLNKMSESRLLEMGNWERGEGRQGKERISM